MVEYMKMISSVPSDLQTDIEYDRSMHSDDKTQNWTQEEGFLNSRPVINLLALPKHLCICLRILGTM